MNRRYKPPRMQPWRLHLGRSDYYSAYTEGPRHGRDRYSDTFLDPYLNDLSLNDDFDDAQSGIDRPPRYERRSWRSRKSAPQRNSSGRHGKHRVRSGSESSEFEDSQVQGRRSTTGNEGISQRGKTRLPIGRDQSICFDHAMKRLFGQVEKAEKFYSTFQLGYDEDVKRIKNYAQKSLLKALWIGRVQGNKAVSDGSSSHTEDGTDDSYVEKFREINSKLRKALEAAIDSSLHLERWPLSEGKKVQNKSRKEAAERLLGKVETANEQIVGLLEAADRNRENCEALLVELNLLKHLIDPAVEGNKKLYRSDGDDSREENVAND